MQQNPNFGRSNGQPYFNGQPGGPADMPRQGQGSAQNAFPLYYRNAPDNVTAESFIPPVNISAERGTNPKDSFGQSSANSTAFDDLDLEMDKAFITDETYNPFAESAVTARKIAEEFLQVIKTNFPNRYFILKRITQSPEFWEICLQKNFVIINEDNYIKKLQNCFEVSILPGGFRPL